jgi:hypothetical protein
MQLDNLDTNTIRAERPLYNVWENLENLNRIPPPAAIRQRRVRDAAQGRPRWVHPDDRPGPVLVAASSRAPAPRRWSPVQIKAGLWMGSWVLTAVAVWGALFRYGGFDTWTQRAVCGLVVAPVLLAWSLAGAPFTRRQWRRVRRRGWLRWMR